MKKETETFRDKRSCG